MADILDVRSEQAAEVETRGTDPSMLEHPAFLMAPPFSYSTSVPNNVWMEELEPDKREPDAKRAFRQFAEVYRYISSEALVYLLPASKDLGLQDLVFTANLGIVLENGIGDKSTVVVSNYTPESRRGETPVGEAFFKGMGYETHVAPARFEGEAELKHLHDDVYVGGYGIRSELAAYEWMQDKFGMEIVPLRMTDKYLYHLDCTVFPLTRQHTLVCTELYEPEEISMLEKQTEIIDVSADDCFSGICNSLRLGNVILNSSHIHELKRGTEDYGHEVKKNRKLEDIAGELAFEVNYFNLSEYHKGGALLSCMVMHLNRHSYSYQLV